MVTSVRVLSKEDEKDAAAEVTWEDQQNINTFSRLSMRLNEDELRLKELQEEKELYADATEELELADESETVPYRIGGVFVHLPLDEAQQRLEKDGEGVLEQAQAVEDRISALQEDMVGLKAKLYGKFGRSINLER